MKKNQGVLRDRGLLGSEVAWTQSHATVRRSVGVRSFPVAAAAAKHQIHRVPFLRVGGSSCSAR